MEKIKVVFLHHKLVCGGAEQALYDLIQLLDKSKFDISVLVLEGDGEWEEKFKNAGINVVHLLARREKGTGLIVFLCHQWRKICRIALMRSRNKRLITHIFPEGVDLIVSYHVGEAYGMPFSEHAKSVKFIHGNVVTNESYCKDMLALKDILPNYHRIVCVSDLVCNAFKSTIGIADTVEMHYNPINSESVRSMAEESVEIPKDLPVICSVGRLSPEKGYARLIQIHRNIIDQGIAHRLVIVGDGPEKENLLKTIEETGTKDSVYMVGYKCNPYPYIQASSFMVCSSYTEGLPVTAMEALSLGIPIVSAVPSIGEAFGEECCGIITENDDNSLEHGIRKMLEDHAFYEETRQSAIRRSTFFDGKRMVKEIEDLFIELVESA